MLSSYPFEVSSWYHCIIRIQLQTLRHLMDSYQLNLPLLLIFICVDGEIFFGDCGWSWDWGCGTSSFGNRFAGGDDSLNSGSRFTVADGSDRFMGSFWGSAGGWLLLYKFHKVIRDISKWFRGDVAFGGDISPCLGGVAAELLISLLRSFMYSNIRASNSLGARPKKQQ